MTAWEGDLAWLSTDPGELHSFQPAPYRGSTHPTASSGGAACAPASAPHDAIWPRTSLGREHSSPRSAALLSEAPCHAQPLFLESDFSSQPGGWQPETRVPAVLHNLWSIWGGSFQPLQSWGSSWLPSLSPALLRAPVVLDLGPACSSMT